MKNKIFTIAMAVVTIMLITFTAFAADVYAPGMEDSIETTISEDYIPSEPTTSETIIVEEEEVIILEIVFLFSYDFVIFNNNLWSD